VADAEPSERAARLSNDEIRSLRRIVRDGGNIQEECLFSVDELVMTIDFLARRRKDLKP
jgi:hypothetical protein